MYSNKRREHIHIIRQFEIMTEKYTGTRIVVFKKDGFKFIKDYDNFIKHRYKSPKSKIHSKSLWKIEECKFPQIIKKVMFNTNEEKTLIMKHILYESPKLSISEYYKYVLKEENIVLDIELENFVEY